MGGLALLAFVISRAGRVTVSGTVTSRAGQPLTGLTIRARPLPFSVPWSDNLVDPFDKRVHAATTDQDGRYRLRGLSSQRYRASESGLARLLAPFLGRRIPSYPQEYELVLDANGFAVLKVVVTTDAGDIRDLDFVLDPGASITGRAIDTAGHPLAARSLCLVPERRIPAGHGCFKNLVPDISATDTSGGFRLVRVPPGIYRLELAVYPERGWEVTQSATNGLLRIAPGEVLGPLDFFFEAPEERGRIAARVVAADSGFPVAAFSFRVLGVAASGAGSSISGCVIENGERVPLLPSGTASGRQGHLRIEDISPGTATIEILAEGYARKTFPIRVLRGQTTEVTLALEPEGILQGRVTRSGRACGLGYVNLRRAGAAPETGVDAHTDASGRYAYQGLPTGEYLLRMTVWLREDAPFSAQATDFVRVHVQEGQTTELDFEFARGASLRGSFRASDRKLRWVVLVEDASPSAAALAPQDRVRGSAWKIERPRQYAIEGLAPGTYTVTAKCLRNDETGTPVAEQSKTISLTNGENAQLDFKF